MLLYSRWTFLTLSTRQKLAAQFEIPKKYPTHVDSNVLKSDGYDVSDIEKQITAESMSIYLGILGDNANFSTEELWYMTVDKMEGRESLAVAPAPTVQPTPSVSVLPSEEAKQFKTEYKFRENLKKTRTPKVKLSATVKTTKKNAKSTKTK